MFVHVDTKAFERRPFLGVALGIGSLALWTVLGVIIFQEYKGFGKTPARVDLNTVAPPHENHGNWVEVRQPLVLHCNLNLQQLREPPESWLFGKVEQTFFMADAIGLNRTVLMVYDGDVRCAEAAKKPLIGVLEELNSRRRRYLTANGLAIPAGADLELMVGDGPANYRKIMLECSFLPLLSIFIIWHFWPKWRAQVRRAENLGPVSGYGPGHTTINVPGRTY